MKHRVCRAVCAGVLSVLCLVLVAAPASAAEEPYEFNANLSLTGDCSKSSADPIPDPDCPYPPLPDRPSGRFNIPMGTAVDAYGNLYVASFGNGKGRIDIFDDEGHFISELIPPHGPKGLAVDKDGNLYVYEDRSPGGDVIALYEPADYEPELAEENVRYEVSGRVVVDDTTGEFNVGIGSVAVDTETGHLYASFWGNFVNEYGSATEGNPLLATITHEKLKKSVFLAVDAERRRLFTSNCKNANSECGILVFESDSPHALEEEVYGTPSGPFLTENGYNSVAVDEKTGHFFIEDYQKTPKIFEFGEDFEYLSTINHSALEAGPLLHQISLSNSTLDPGAKNNHYLFAPIPKEAGNVFAYQPPGVRPPVLSDLRVTNISEREAELQATIDPRGGKTDYAFEYVTEQGYEESGFAGAEVVQGTIPANALATRVVAPLSGLTPGTTYRFRVTATNEKDSVEDEGPVFATYDDASTVGPCPNESLRMGPSGMLPDCRAYELVTPPDTNGRPPKGLQKGEFLALHASPLGNAISFISEGGSLPGTEGTGGFQGDRYRTTRGPTGWSTVSTGPNGVETNNPAPGSSSPDQDFGFWASGGVGTKVVEGQAAYYVMYPDGHSELVGRGSLGVDPRAQGQLITEGGSHIVFETSDSFGTPPQLEPDAPPTGTAAVYDRVRDPETGVETTHVVSLLPGDETPTAGEDAAFVGASSDAGGIAFQIAGTLYLRVANEVTYEIGDGLTFAGVSEAGRRIFYVEGGDLLAFDTEEEEDVVFTETAAGIQVVNVAPDGSRAYFTSKEAIPGSGTNPLGDDPQAGQNNLYLSEEGTISFVATVTERDVVGEKGKDNIQTDGLGLWTDVLPSQLARDPSRVDFDGSVLLFQSRANLVGYDSGSFPQIYRYDRAGNRLHCISCIPTKAAASGGASLQSLRLGSLSVQPLGAVGFVPLPEDGSRAFFESEEALVSSDNNGVRDVYEWEEQGIGSCDRAGGCVYLISSGHSIRDNFLYGASSSGDDVFFVTDDVLVAGDNDTASIYDARVGGGFPQAVAPPCSGEGCRPPLIPAPGVTPPAAPAPPGANDNVKPKIKKKPCGKGKRRVVRKGRKVCIKKKQGKRPHRKAGAKRGGSK